jgi:hypothetical protein
MGSASASVFVADTHDYALPHIVADANRYYDTYAIAYAHCD